MAFTTVQGSGGAPDSYVGTTGVDAIALVNSNGNFFLGANAANDNIQSLNSGSALYGGVLASSTLKGGAGEDTFSLGSTSDATVYTGVFLNGNAGRDTIGIEQDDTFISSTIKGGAANDGITTGILTASFINGNKGIDTITTDEAVTASTVYGGGGNDIIDIGNSAANAFTTSLVSGDLGNDTIDVDTAGASIDSSTILGGDGVDTIDLVGSGATTDEGIFVNGNAGDDDITGSSIALAAITLNGGAGDDEIDSASGTTTAIGGSGLDTMEAGAGTNTFGYTAIGEGGANASATSTTAVAIASDLIGSGTAFETDDDKINFAADALIGSTAAAVSGATNDWNLNNAGVFVDTDTFAYVQDTTSVADISTEIGTVIGTAGDVAYYVIEDTTVANDTLIFQVTLGTTRTSTGALNAGDDIAFLARVSADDGLTKDDFTFLG